MNIIIGFTGYFFIGMILGLFYFGGLWLTVQNLEKRSHPYFLLMLSFFIRAIVLLIGLFLILQLGWFGLAGGLMGFFIMRIILVNLVKSATVNPDRQQNI